MPGSYIYSRDAISDRRLTGEQEASSSKSSGGGLVHGFERGLVVVLRKSGGLSFPGSSSRDVTLADFRHGGKIVLWVTATGLCEICRDGRSGTGFIVNGVGVSWKGD